MIYITLGTSPYPFPRLLQEVDIILEKIRSKEKVIAQIGCTQYTFKYKNVKTYSEIPFDQNIRYVQKARLVICHAGCGTIMQCIFVSKKIPFVVAREKKYREHIDDHQKYFARYMKKNNSIETEDLIKYIRFPKDTQKTGASHQEIVRNLKKFIASFP